MQHCSVFKPIELPIENAYVRSSSKMIYSVDNTGDISDSFFHKMIHMAITLLKNIWMSGMLLKAYILR